MGEAVAVSSVSVAVFGEVIMARDWVVRGGEVGFVGGLVVRGGCAVVDDAAERRMRRMWRRRGLLDGGKGEEHVRSPCCIL